MATQAEINKLWAEQLAKTNGTTQDAETLRKQALGLGLTPEQLNIAELSAFNASNNPEPVKSDGGSGMPSMRPVQSDNLAASARPTSANLGFGSGGGYKETSADSIKQAFNDLSASGMSEQQIMQKVAGMAAQNGWSTDQLTAGAQAVNPNITKDQVSGYLKQSNIDVNSNGLIGAKDAAPAPQAQQAAPAATVQTQTAGPAATAQAQGYQAQNTNLAGQYNAMGLSDPSGANARLLSGQVNNQYLDSQADNITKRLNRNLQENILPGIGQGAQMAGQYGGSRQGIAQGKAIGDTQDNLANALTNMYSSANEAAQNRMGVAAGNLSGIGAQVGIANTAGVNAANQFGANAANTAGMFNAGQMNSMGQFNAGAMNQGNMFNAGQTNANNQFNAGQANNFNLGLMNNQTQNRSIDNQYALGNAANQNQARSIDNQYALGNASNMNQSRSIDNAWNLGQGNLALGNRQADNAYTLGQGNLALGNRQADNAYTLGQGNLALGNKQADNSYSVGMAGVGASTMANQNNYNLGMSQLDSANQRFGQQFGLDVLNSQYNWANGGVNAANNMQQAPIGYFNNFNGNANQIAGQGGQNSQTLQGNPYLGAAGGYQLANKWLGY